MNIKSLACALCSVHCALCRQTSALNSAFCTFLMMMIDDPTEEDEKINYLECVQVYEDKHEDDDFENYALEHYDYVIMPMTIYIK